MGYWWILMDVQTCWFPTLYIIQYNILMNGTLYPKKRSSFRLMFRQIVHGKRGRKLGWSSKVPSLQQTSVQIHISRLWFILFIYIIIHIYSVSKIKQKSENSFRTPLNIFPFFFLQIYKKSTFCHLPLGSNVPPGCHGDEGLHPCVQTSPATDRDTHQWRPAGGAFQGGDPFKIKWFIVDL